MISRIDHIAIAVSDHEKARNFFEKILGAIPGTYAQVDSMKYIWRNFALGDLSRLELLSPTGKGSFLKNFLKNREGGVHHISLQTPDITKARQTLEQNNIPYFGYKEYIGGIWTELFIHPRDAFGVLIQIAQFNPDDWIAQSVKFPSGVRWSVEKSKKGALLSLAHPGGGKVSIELGKNEIKDLIDDMEKML